MSFCAILLILKSYRIVFPYLEIWRKCSGSVMKMKQRGSDALLMHYFHVYRFLKFH